MTFKQCLVILAPNHHGTAIRQIIIASFRGENGGLLKSGEVVVAKIYKKKGK